jgi:GTP-binding protein Era
MVPTDDSTPNIDAALSHDDDAAWDEVEQALELEPARTGIRALPAADPASWDEVERDLEQIMGAFQGLQDDLNYRRAQDALEDLVKRLDLSPRELAGLSNPLRNLTGLMDKLDQAVVHIAVFGLVGRGKSSLLNALIDRNIFATGPTHGVTQAVEGTTWSVNSEPIGDDGPEVLKVSLQSVGHSSIELIDTPGLDEVGGATREALAKRIAEQVDLILFVIAGDISRVEYDALKALRQASKPMVLVFNKVDQYPEADRQALYTTLKDDRLKNLISPDEIVMTAASPLVVRAISQEDGQVTYETVRGTPQVDDLKLKILDILHREGKALVALNTLMYAEAVSEEILQRKQAICDRIAEDTIWNGVMIKAMAIAFNPITMADLFSGAVIDVSLIVTLSRLYGLPMTQTGAIKLLRQVAFGLGGISASELIVTLGLSSLKGLLGASSVATGGLALAPYLPIAMTQATIAGGFTYSIGQITKTYLINGASWGPDGPKVVMQGILDSLDETSILHRIKDELRAKLSL